MSLSFSHPAALWALLVIIPVLLVPVLARGRQWRATPGRTWWSIGLRTLIALALVLGLAGTQVVRAVDALTTVYVLDFSDSVPAAERARGEAFVREAVQAMPAGDRAAIVAFGENAVVERLASEQKNLPRIASVPVATRSNIAGALQLALALFPDASRRRVVILSDGLENVGSALAQADLAAARDVEVSYVLLSAPQGEAEAYIDFLEAPSGARLGQSFDVTAVIESVSAQQATLRLYADGVLIRSVDVNLQPGTNRLRIPVEASAAGFQRYRAELLPATDTLPQNNTAAGFTVVEGPPRILVVEGNPGEAEQLVAALAASQVEAEVVAPEEMPQDLGELSAYDAVYLVNAPAGALPPVTMEALPRYVSELGRGLVMAGGEASFGAGGYLRSPVEEALPVDMDVRNKEQEPNLALVLAVDKSGSMGQCHCDNPNLLPGQYDRVASGLPKVDIAKEAILRTYGALGRLDFLGVVAFDQDAHWAVELQQLVNVDQIQNSVGGVQAFGQTNVFAGLSEAERALADVDAKVKHIILLTDGWSQSGSYDDLVAQMQEEGITLSVIAAGGGSAPYLLDLAERGGGRYYPAEDIQQLPEVFLKETIQAVGRYIIEEPFYPVQTASTPILDGIGSGGVPGLYGYNGTTPKGTARVSLVTAQGDPLLAQWQYGLGRSVAWTSDFSGRWAAEWVNWDEFVRFVGQLSSWVLPQPASKNLQTSLRLEGNSVVVDVDALDDAGRPWNFLDVNATVIGPDLAPQQVALAQIAPGHYQGRAAVYHEGTHLVQVAAGTGGTSAAVSDTGGLALATTGFVVPYSPEYKHASTAAGQALLRDLAQATGGEELVAPPDSWLRHGAPARAAQPVAWPLLLLAALLFPLDVAVRRLRLGRREWISLQANLLANLRARVGRLVPSQRSSRPGPGTAGPLPAEPQVLGDLYAARARARRRAQRSSAGDAGGTDEQAGNESK